MLTCLGGFGKPTNPASKLLVAVVTHGEISDPNHSKVCVLFCFFTIQTVSVNFLFTPVHPHR